MDELVDILDADGNFTGKTAMKSEAHRKGLFHPTVHIWLYTGNGKVLIQQRGKDKTTFPLLWDVSVAGHVGAGEEIELSALREVEEEIGLTIAKGDLQKIGIFKSVQKHRADLIDCEFHHTFLCELKTPLKNLKKQESEVAALALISISKFAKEIQDTSTYKKYVAHDLSYYRAVLEAIRKRL